MDGKLEKLYLKRDLGLVSAVSLIAGTMIGSGIFMSPQSVLVNIGSPGGSLVIWAACGLLAALGCLCYAELGTVIRESGGEYIYILRTSGPVLAFMLIFSSVIFMRPASVAGISLSFAEYAVAPFYPDCLAPQLVVKCVAAAGIVVTAIVNCLNVRFAMSLQVFFMVAKVLGLLVIIIGGVVLLVNGEKNSLTDSFEGTNVGINPIGIAFYQGLWSYDGWNNLNYVTEELKRPECATVVAIMTVTIAKVLSLMVIVIGGIVIIAQGKVPVHKNAFDGTNSSVSAIVMAFYQALWSFAGWYNLNNVTEELKRPEVNLLRAVLIAISMVTLLYLLVNVSYLAAMTPRELMSSSAVAVTWGNKVLGSWGWVMSIAAALSAFGSLNGLFFSGGRVCFVAARERHLPDILAMAHVKRLTPSPALIFTTAISLLVLIPGDFQSIVNFLGFTSWFFYAITLSGLLYLKIKKPKLPRSYRVPIVIPVLVIMAAIFLVLAPIIDNPAIEYLYVTLFVLSGVLVYVLFIHYKFCPGMFDKLTLFLQLFLEVSPAEKNL